MAKTTPDSDKAAGASDFSDWPRGSTRIFIVHYTVACPENGLTTETIHARTKEEARNKAIRLRPDGDILRIEKVRRGSVAYPSARFINGRFLAGTTAEERQLLNLSK